MGSVTLLTGQPKEGVFIEARSESRGYYEEATTDYFGRFRLRGLVPGSTYSERVAAKDSIRLAAVERASPEFVSIDVSYCGSPLHAKFAYCILSLFTTVNDRGTALFLIRLVRRTSLVLVLWFLNNQKQQF
jgi:hypothetical protein